MQGNLGPSFLAYTATYCGVGLAETQPYSPARPSSKYQSKSKSDLRNQERERDRVNVERRERRDRDGGLWLGERERKGCRDKRNKGYREKERKDAEMREMGEKERSVSHCCLVTSSLSVPEVSLRT